VTSIRAPSPRPGEGLSCRREGDVLDAQQVIFGAAEFTAGTAADERFVRAVENNLKLSGREILKHVRSSDRGGIFTPAHFMIDGKELRGCVLTLQDRAILAWRSGSFRIRDFSEVVPYASVKNVELRRSATEETRIDLAADRSYSLSFVYDGGKGFDIPSVLVGVLEGSIQFGHEG
jgi:hypothetical protein